MNKISLLPALLLLVCGCATPKKTVEFPVTPRMAITSAEEGNTVTWKTEPGQKYTIFYTDAPAGKLPDWKPLPQATGLSGTGQTVTIHDKPRESLARRYLLLTGDRKPY